MTLLAIATLMGLGTVAGVLGALVGIGGGILVVPALTLLLGVELRHAISTSLVAVVATSSAAGSVYVGAGTANLRLGMLLEVATALGGITGGLLAARVPTPVLGGVFAALLAITAALMVARRDKPSSGGASAARGVPADAPGVVPRAVAGPVNDAASWEERGSLAGAYVDDKGAIVRYQPTRAPLGLLVSLGAGIASGLLGVGGGFLKVPAMSLGMGVPFKVAAATSNFMIGVTATASLFIYFARGDVVPSLVTPVAIGVAMGAMAGTRLSRRAPVHLLKWVMALLLVVVAVQMVLRAAGGHLG